jgi:hypothetical protein
MRPWKLSHFFIHRNRNESISLNVRELHHLMASPCELRPRARLVWILLDDVKLLTVDGKAHRSQALAAGVSHRQVPARLGGSHITDKCLLAE